MDHTKRSYHPKDMHDDTFANLHVDTLDAMAKAWEVAGSTQAWMEDVVRQEDFQLDNHDHVIWRKGTLAEGA